MLVLHAAWLPIAAERRPALALWAETDAPLRRGSGRGRGAMPPLHPFAAGHAALREALVGVSPDSLAAAADADAIAQLPSAEGVPFPSPELGPASHSSGPIAASLAACSVRVLALPAADAVRLLSVLQPERAPGALVLGADVRFWQQFAQFALSLLARQRLAPDLDVVDARFVARWRPLVGEGEDARRVEALAAAMPSAARALAWQADASAAGPRTTLLDFLGAATDGLARIALATSVRPPADAAPVEAWLAALCGNAMLAGRPIELAAFRQVLQRWASPAGSALGAGAPFRLCFRLEPPLNDVTNGRQQPDPWRLSYLLQATDDPSLLVAAADVWHVRGSTASFLDRRFEHPQERVLAALGRAARLFPPVERSLRSATPDSCDLDTDDAYRFVREAGPLLAETGFGVLLPGMETRLGLRVRLASKSASSGTNAGPAAFSWDSVVSFDWEIAVGGETISRAEFEELVALKAPLVQVRGQWVELRPELVENALKLLKEHPAGAGVTLAEALRIALAPEEAGALPVDSVATDGTFGDLLRQLGDDAEREEVEAPSGFTGQLRPYQKVGLSWLATLRRFGLGACLADDMGLGKTVQLIALMLHRRRNNPEATAPALLICPTSVAANWRKELERFAPSLRVLVHHGAGRNRDELAEEAARHDVVVSTYALLHRDSELLNAVAWDEVILDEAQNIKNPGTRAAQAARALTAQWRTALTGTPVENRLSDLWSIFQFLNPGLLPPAAEFRRTFAAPIERTGDAAVAGRLQKLVGPFILRRLKSDKSIIQDLPEKNEMKVFCTLTREQATLYQAVLKESLDAIDESDGIQRRGQILATLTKLKQVCDHPALLLHDGSRLAGRSGKLARLTEMLEEVVGEGDRALIFTQYAEMGKMLVEHLQAALGQEALFLHGGTTAAARERMVARFQAEGRGPQIFVLSIKAGGTGLNLTRANHVFHFDRWWNPAVENQATDRAFRIGQRRDVQVHKYVCAGTFEETLDQLIERKLALAESIVGTSESWITELSSAELRDMFRLRPEATAEE
ncbi:MAG: DEAD/DEAH box helicase [Dehalococcoidia bacterium]